MVLAKIVRGQGDARIASIGMSLGGVLNMVMDPVFIFTMGMGVAGAALSTCLSNTVSLIFLLIHVVRHRKSSLVVIPALPRRVTWSTQKDIYSIGTPAALQILLAAVSNAVLLRLMSAYPVAATSGMGVMQKVESIPFQAIMGIACACVSFLLCEIFAPAIVRFFVDDAGSVAYGAEFVRLRTLALPFITVEFMLIAVFQGIGGAKQALFLSLFRKGILDLPLMALFNLIWPMYGLMLVQPIMECCGAIIAVVLYKRLSKCPTAALPGQKQLK